MQIYNVYTAKGVCECHEVNGVYHPIKEEDLKFFLFEPIITVERKD